MKTKNRPYQGKLRQKIILPDGRNIWERLAQSATLLTQYELDEEQALLNEERAGKFPLLFEHFHIDATSPDAWKQLAASLAATHVPGFQFQRAQGAPVKVDFSILCDFYRHIIKRKSVSNNQTVSAICRGLPRQKEFREKFPTLAGLTGKRLANIYSEAKSYRKTRVAWIISNWRRIARGKQAIRDDIDRFGISMGDAPPWWPD